MYLLIYVSLLVTSFPVSDHLIPVGRSDWLQLISWPYPNPAFTSLLLAVCVPVKEEPLRPCGRKLDSEVMTMLGIRASAALVMCPSEKSPFCQQFDER